jgi:hypothetical protein
VAFKYALSLIAFWYAESYSQSIGRDLPFSTMVFIASFDFVSRCFISCRFSLHFYAIISDDGVVNFAFSVD